MSTTEGTFIRLLIYALSCREVGTIIRSLNCYPSEAELHDMIQEVEEEEPTGFIRLEKFQPMMARVLMERRYITYSFIKLIIAMYVQICG